MRKSELEALVARLEADAKIHCKVRIDYLRGWKEARREAVDLKARIRRARSLWLGNSSCGPSKTATAIDHALNLRKRNWRPK